MRGGTGILLTRSLQTFAPRARIWELNEVGSILLGGHMERSKQIRIVFDAPPGRNMPTLVEVEDEQGRCIDAGQWRERPDGYWELVLEAESR